jgi:hypothetical protein
VVRVEVAEPVFGVVVIWMVWVGEGFELRIEAGDAAAIFRRRRIFAGEVARIGRAWLGSAGFGQGELVFPAIAKVVDVIPSPSEGDSRRGLNEPAAAGVG